MSIAQITRVSVLDAIRHGRTSRALLAEFFEVLPASVHLADVLDPLIAAGVVVEHEGGALHVNDLMEQLPHDLEEKQ